MATTDSNPKLSKLVQIAMIVETLVLLPAAGGLIFLAAMSRPNWPWELTPFNAGFLGAIYTASLVVVAMLAQNTRWSPARVLLPMICTFTLWAVFISFVYLPRFDLGKGTTWAWFIFYVLLPAGTGYFLWQYRKLPPANAISVPNPYRTLLLMLGGALMLYAVALIAVPAVATSFWPWGIDEFHARMYASMFLSGGVGTLLIANRVSREELRILGIGQFVFGALVLIELFVVDSQVHKINWAAPTTWVWIAIFAGAVISGVVYFMLSRQTAQVSTAAAAAD